MKNTDESADLKDQNGKPNLPKHTPGPWTVEESSWDGTEYWVVKSGETIVCMEPTTFYAYPEGPFIDPYGIPENAKLIAAAPLLLKACERAIVYLENASDNISYAVELSGDVHEDAMQQNIKTGIQEIESAISKALG